MGAEKIWDDAMEEAVAAIHEDNVISDLPSSSQIIDIALDLPQMKPRIISLCKYLFKKWSSLEDSSFSVETVFRGVTNLCELKTQFLIWIDELFLFPASLNHLFVLKFLLSTI